MMIIKHESQKKLNRMMIVTVVMEIIQKWTQIHLSNLVQKTSKKIKQEVQKCLVEDDDDRSKSCESENSCFSQISSTEP
jgi:hypothetical protein